MADAAQVRYRRVLLPRIRGEIPGRIRGANSKSATIWPRSARQMESGRLLDVRAYTPRFHGDGRQDWTFEVAITYRDWPSMEEHTDPAHRAPPLPRRGEAKRGAARNGTVLEAHWDTPLEEHALRGSEWPGPGGRRDPWRPRPPVA